MKNLLFLFCILGVASQLKGQETVFGNNSLGLTGAWGAFSYNFSYFESDEDIAYIRGGYGGLEFGNSVFLGWGGYKLKDNVLIEGINEAFNLKYNGLMIDFHPGAHKVVHPRFGVLIGGGKVSLSDGVSDRVFVAQPSVGLELNVFKWFRLGLQGGYRFVTNEGFPDVKSADLSSPFGQIDLRFGISWGRKRSRKKDRDRD